MKTLYSEISKTFQAHLKCIEMNSTEWKTKHRERIEYLVKHYFPFGFGFDSTKFDFESSKPDKLVFRTGYHHMNEAGYYDGWTHHTVIVTPSLAFGFNLRITGNNRNDIKNYIHECFSTVDSYRESLDSVKAS